MAALSDVIETFMIIKYEYSKKKLGIKQPYPDGSIIYNLWDCCLLNN